MNPSVLQRIASGDSAAVRECMDQYGALVWSLARRLSRTASDAEDATQEIFLDIWRSAGRFDAAQGSDKMFIAMIARRRLIDRLRKKSAEPPMDPVEVLESVAWPESGGSTPASMRMVVVLPAPSGPTNPKISPECTSKLSSCTARTGPKLLPSETTSMAGR